MNTPTLIESFDQLELSEELLRALSDAGHERPTPIQAAAIGPALAGRDVLGCAQTGTGKTAAFALPILQRLERNPDRRASLRALVLSPTRELAAQIVRELERYGRYTRLRHTAIYGGVSQHAQVRALRAGVDVLVATPGRLWDLIEQKIVDLSKVEILVLDEADRMFDQGFLPVLRRILAVVPRVRQTLFFSATMPDELRPLAERSLKDPVRIEPTVVASTPDRIDQTVYFVERPDKRALLQHVLRDGAITRALVFTRTKHGADRIAKLLVRSDVAADAIHGNKTQGARERALSRFRDGALRVLVATDVAARGIDIDSISHVVNFDLPNDPEGYVHRIGRTARAGAVGKAISFCSADERSGLLRIERLIRRRVRVVGDHPYSPPVPRSASSRS